MKQFRTLSAAAAVALLLAANGCKTTEANYRAAYEKAVARQNEGLTPEELQGFEREKAVPVSIWRGDSIPLRARYAKTMAETPQTTAAARYNIIVAEFTQRFNATSAAERARTGGYPRRPACFSTTKSATTYRPCRPPPSTPPWCFCTMSTPRHRCRCAPPAPTSSRSSAPANPYKNYKIYKIQQPR